MRGWEKELKNKLIFGLVVCSLLVPLLEGKQKENRMKTLKKLLKNSVPIVAPGQLKELLEYDSPMVLLDAREKEECDVSHLPGALYAGYKSFDLVTLKDVHKDSLVIVYCSLGIRSEEVGEKLQEAGFTKVRNLFGGLFQWVNLGFPIYNSKNKTTRKVHPYSEQWGQWLKKGKKTYKK